jgi:plastocyanin
MGGGQVRIRGSRRLGAAALVAVLLVALSVGVASAGGNRVRASNFHFKPRTITIQKGERVVWKRTEGRHTVTLKTGSFDKVISASHPRASKRFRHRGTFRYYCRFHRSLGMRGKVVVE